MSEVNPDRLYSTGEAARLLGLSRSHVNRLARSGELPSAQRLGPGDRAAYLFRRIDLEQFAAEHLPVPPIHRQATLDSPDDDDLGAYLRPDEAVAS